MTASMWSRNLTVRLSKMKVKPGCFDSICVMLKTAASQYKLLGMRPRRRSLLLWSERSTASESLQGGFGRTIGAVAASSPLSIVTTGVVGWPKIKDLHNLLGQRLRSGRRLGWRRYKAAWTGCVPEGDRADLASLTRRVVRSKASTTLSNWIAGRRDAISFDDCAFERLLTSPRSSSAVRQHPFRALSQVTQGWYLTVSQSVSQSNKHFISEKLRPLSKETLNLRGTHNFVKIKDPGSLGHL